MFTSRLGGCRAIPIPAAFAIDVGSIGTSNALFTNAERHNDRRPIRRLFKPRKSLRPPPPRVNPETAAPAIARNSAGICGATGATAHAIDIA